MNELYHHGIKGQRWGIRRYQNADGTLTPAGQKRAVRQLNRIEKKKNAVVGKHLAKTADAEYRKSKYTKAETKLIKNPESKRYKKSAHKSGVKYTKALAKVRETEHENNRLNRERKQLVDDLIKSNANVSVKQVKYYSLTSERGYQYLQKNSNKYLRQLAPSDSNIVGTYTLEMYGGPIGYSQDRYVSNIRSKYKYNKK